MYIINNSPNSKQYTYLVCSANFRDLQEFKLSNKGKDVDKKDFMSKKCPKGTKRFRYKQAEEFILDNVNEFGVSDVMQLRRADDDLRKRDEELASLTVKLEDFMRKEARLLTVIESEDVGNIPGLLTLARKRTQEREDTEALIRTLKHERDVALAKKQGLDPASSVQAMRRAWLSTEDENDRYGLRVRCNTAMRDFIQDVQFDSIEGSYTLILFGGYRAYKFFNVPVVRNATQRPLVVDMQPLVDTGLWPSNPAHSGAELSPDLQRINVREGATFVRTSYSLLQKRSPTVE
jgi:hypothetical protein